MVEQSPEILASEEKATSADDNRVNSGRCQEKVIINPLTARVVGAPQMISQPVFSIVPCSPLPSGTCPTPGLSIP